MYLHGRINQKIYDTTSISVKEEEAIIEMVVTDKYFHAMNAMHGSVYFKLLDDAAFFAVNSIVKDFFVLTTSFHIQLTRPVTEGKIKAVGKLKFKSRSLFVAEATLYNEQGKEVAFGTGNFMISKAPLSEDIGYKI